MKMGPLPTARTADRNMDQGEVYQPDSSQKTAHGGRAKTGCQHYRRDQNRQFHEEKQQAKSDGADARLLRYKHIAEKPQGDEVHIRESHPQRTRQPAPPTGDRDSDRENDG
jgi:hypothetical protein